MIGYCSGGRQSVLAACNLTLDAAVDCYGAFVLSTRGPRTADRQAHASHRPAGGALSCPLLGLFGREDTHPSPEEVDELDALLTGRWQGARVPLVRRRRPRLLRRQPRLATGSRRHRTAGSTFATSSVATSAYPVLRGAAMCTYTTDDAPSRAAARAGRVVPAVRRPPSTTTIRSTPWRTIRCNIDLAAPAKGPQARVAVELTAESALELVDAIVSALGGGTVRSHQGCA